MRVWHSTNKSSCFISRCVEATPPPYIGYSANISVDVSSYTGNNTPGNVGESRNFTCPQGTVALGKEIITCLANGQWETPRCQVCIESTDPIGENYWGSKNVTYTGKTCQRWDSQTPHSHSYPNNSENYCRNPSNHNGTWCYTTDPDSRWEDCDVPKC
ncbi:plasminogen-like [Crassostrea angulata]|uniref:plasminogen-like n=1 Tax=Magallana angulata TaxID=2784310 RepID=UPI0022B20D38|nr:plasminogen-like [Crassostrea angulata]